MEPKPRILIVDDNEVLTLLLKMCFEARGFEVLAINDSLRAVSAAKKFLPEFILLDVIMPGLCGPELSVQLRQVFPKVPVAFMSASWQNPFPDCAYFEKPFNLQELISHVREEVERSSAPDSIPVIPWPSLPGSQYASA